MTHSFQSNLPGLREVCFVCCFVIFSRKILNDIQVIRSDWCLFSNLQHTQGVIHLISIIELRFMGEKHVSVNQCLGTLRWTKTPNSGVSSQSRRIVFFQKMGFWSTKPKMNGVCDGGHSCMGVSVLEKGVSYYLVPTLTWWKAMSAKYGCFLACWTHVFEWGSHAHSHIFRVAKPV